MIIWAGSFPRSGSTLWRIAWHTFTGLPTYSYANDPILKKVAAVAQRDLPRNHDQMDTFEDRPDIYMIKAHLHPSVVDPKDRSRKMFIVRDVRDMVVSLAHYTSWRHKKQFPAELQRIVDNTQWLHFCNAWMPAAGATVRYEDLRKAPADAVREVVKALDVPVSIRERPFPQFARLHRQEPRFFRQGVVGGWRAVLSEAQEQQLWDQFGEKMTELGYER